jgi:hypothetical protein
MVRKERKNAGTLKTYHPRPQGIFYSLLFTVDLRIIIPIGTWDQAQVSVIDRLCNNRKLPIIHATIYPIPIL